MCHVSCIVRICGKSQESVAYFFDKDISTDDSALDYLREARGLARATIVNYVPFIAVFSRIASILTGAPGT
jgi:hypothetical protein